MNTTEELWDLKDWAPHMHGDVMTRNNNIEANKELCMKCEGTGNMGFSMYIKCDKCKGTGIKE
ncbi:MAG: hypothetical protein GY861_04625 [bacterium]|nr:hypothetical protein [bacterium]